MRSKIAKNCEGIFYMRPAGSQICHGFKDHDLITSELNVSLGSELVSFDPLHVTRSVPLQSENVFELRGITNFFDLNFFI